MSRMTPLGHLARQLFLVLVGMFVLLPIWVLVLMATDGSIIGYPSGFHPIPVQPTLERFADAFFRPGAVLDYWGLLRNSLLVSISAAAVALFLGATMAYAFAGCGSRARTWDWSRSSSACSCRRSPSRCPCSSCSTLERNVPLDEFGLRDSLLALSILYAAFAMPLSLAHASGVPSGARRARGGRVRRRRHAIDFRRITLPLALPSILVAALVAFLLAYTEFALAWLFISSKRERDARDDPRRGDDRLLHVELERHRRLRAADGDPGRDRVHAPPARATPGGAGGGRERLRNGHGAAAPGSL